VGTQKAGGKKKKYKTRFYGRRGEGLRLIRKKERDSMDVQEMQAGAKSDGWAIGKERKVGNIGVVF